MKITVLSGAYKNAGDFLIVERSVQLLRKQFQGSQIEVIKRDKDLEDVLPILNMSKAIILAGGPLYVPEIYPKQIPLVKDLSMIRTKIFTLGCGWNGISDSAEYIYNCYQFSAMTKGLLKRIECDSKCLSCRDWYSVSVLKANDIEKTKMTGCPAWYDLDYVHDISVNESVHLPFNKICISDPAKLQNLSQALNIVRYLREKYRDVKLCYIFHRGEIKSEKLETFKRQLKQMDVLLFNIEGSEEGFSVYNDCDLHIGYRVHAHIYNLSRRNLSILIEEDGRGAGVNHALGLERIKAYKDNYHRVIGNSVKHKVQRRIQNKVYGRGNYLCNEWVLKEIDDYLKKLEETEYKIYEAAYTIMKNSYSCMKEYLRNMEECIGE